MRETVGTFIALAREDLAVARKVVDEFPRDAAFHIEQVAEKLLKAVLTTEGIKFEPSVIEHQLNQANVSLRKDDNALLAVCWLNRKARTLSAPASDRL
jgi:HEPN domain-containing protein